MNDKQRDRLRVNYQSHFFEIKEGIFLTSKNIHAFREKVNKAVQKNSRRFRFQDEWFETGYGQFCLQNYDNVPEDFDEQLLEFEVKKKEEYEKLVARGELNPKDIEYKLKGGWNVDASKLKYHKPK
jgi:hypothetical protein